MAPSASYRQKDNLRRLRNCAVCIICGKASEAAEIAKALDCHTRLRGHDLAELENGLTFHIGSMKLQDGDELDYVVTASTRQGIQSFAICAAPLLCVLRPKFVIHTGVCAAAKTESLRIHLGDVIFGEAAFNFEEGKFQQLPTGEVMFAPDYNMIRVNAGDIEAFAEDDTERRGYHYGVFISGSAVREDAAMLFDKFRSQVNRNVKALDMESSVFLQLCQHFHDISCLGIVKGVSDFGDGQKAEDPSVRGKALRNTASALRHWMEISIPAITWEVDYSNEPAADVVSAYYRDTIKQILDNVTQDLPVFERGHPESVADGNLILGLKVVLPKDEEPKEYESLQSISSICNRYNIIQVDIGACEGKRSLYYKCGHLIEFPQALARLARYPDGRHQVKCFGRLLKEGNFWSYAADSIFAEVCGWDEFETWLAAKFSVCSEGD